MTASITILMLILVVAAGVSVLGVLFARDAFDRLHYLGPVTLVGGPALIAAVVVEDGFGVAAGRTVIVVLILVVSGPVLTHATARAGLARGDVERLRGGVPGQADRP